MARVPVYSLYGEAPQAGGQDWMHAEPIQARSRLHDYRIEPHRHEHLFQIVSLTGGTARAVVDATAHDLAAPAIVAVTGLAVHGYAFCRDVEGVVVTLMERDMRLPSLGPPATVVLPEGDAGVEAAIAALIAEADVAGPGHASAMPALIALLAVALARAARAMPLAEPAGDRGLRHARAFRALVEERYRETRSVPDYAGALGIGPAHLNRVSRAVLGASALRVIEGRIALEARRLLIFSDEPVKAIGAELGYEDPAYATRALTRLMGMAPGVYRRIARARGAGGGP